MWSGIRRSHWIASGFCGAPARGTMIQIRNVPDVVRANLKSRAAPVMAIARGVSGRRATLQKLATAQPADYLD